MGQRGVRCGVGKLGGELGDGVLYVGLILAGEIVDAGVQYRQHVELAGLGRIAALIEGGLVKAGLVAALIKRGVVHKVKPVMHRQAAYRAGAANLPLTAVIKGLVRPQSAKSHGHARLIFRYLHSAFYF